MLTVSKVGFVSRDEMPGHRALRRSSLMSCDILLDFPFTCRFCNLGHTVFASRLCVQVRDGHRVHDVNIDSDRVGLSHARRVHTETHRAPPLASPVCICASSPGTPPSAPSLSSESATGAYCHKTLVTRCEHA